MRRAKRGRLTDLGTRGHRTAACAYGWRVSEPVDLPGYHFLGWGPRATGAGPGWNMAHDMFGRCGHCGGMLRLWPEDSVQCSCGRLAMDVDAGRFGSSDGDATIASTTMESSGRGSRANGRAYGGATRYPLQRLLARDRSTIR